MGEVRQISAQAVAAMILMEEALVRAGPVSAVEEMNDRVEG
jgi:hypothetical protein